MRQDNAEGSSGSAPNLSHWQRAVLVGTILGDGCLAKHGRHHRLHVKHKEAHRSLAEFKYGVFRDFITMPMHRFDQQLRGKLYPCVQFATRTSPVFSEWYELFYRDKRKIVPTEIASYLSPQALAVWFMDDGAADYAGVTLQTHSFELEKVDLLAASLRELFDLAVNLRRNRGGWIIYVKAKSVELLAEIIHPYILPEFAYKLQPRRTRTL